MTSQQILQSDVLDILFEGRNKAYGAYLLRRTYPAQLLKAIGITSGLVLLLMLFGGSSKKQSLAPLLKDSIVLTTVNLPEKKLELPKPKITPPPAAAKPVQQTQFLEKITTVEKTINDVATQDKLSTTAIGSTIIAGPPMTGIQPPALPPISGGGTGVAEPVVEKKDPPLPSRQPQFPGGNEAWLKFLSRYLMPPADLEPGEKRSVSVRFAVDEEGVVTNFAVVKSGGADFDNEVIRVLKKMPRWLPAIQQGRPVAVSFTQPVTFVAPD